MKQSANFNSDVWTSTSGFDNKSSILIGSYAGTANLEDRSGKAKGDKQEEEGSSLQDER
jgi:hypothetical protein